jgi:hypothetical protein
MMNQQPQGMMQQGSPMGQAPMQMGGPVGQTPQHLGGLMSQGGMGQGPMGGTEPPGISMHPMIQALLAHLQSQQPQVAGSPVQQQQGPRGAQGGPAGAPYGAYGAFYGDKMPMNTGLAQTGLGSS